MLMVFAGAYAISGYLITREDVRAMMGWARPIKFRLKPVVISLAWLIAMAGVWPLSIFTTQNINKVSFSGLKEAGGRVIHKPTLHGGFGRVMDPLGIAVFVTGNKSGFH